MAVGFVLTQAELVQELMEEFEVDEYKTVQVRIQDLETRTKLDFGSITGRDALEREEAEESSARDVQAVDLESVDDVVL